MALSFSIPTPIGPLLATFSGPDNSHLISLKPALGSPLQSSSTPETPSARRLGEETRDYFQGRIRNFQTPLLTEGTPFQERVWHALRKIPWGETRSYLDIAHAIGAPRASRAVGQAVGKNPLLILIPCHRVISNSGGPGGFSAGLPAKQILLSLEQPRDPNSPVC